MASVPHDLSDHGEEEANARVISDTATGDVPSDRYSLLGVHVSATTFEEARDRVVNAPAEGERLAVHYISVNTIVEADSEPDLKELLNRGDLIAPDGMPLVWLNRLNGYGWTERVYGPDLMLACCEEFEERGTRHFFYGGADGVPQLLAERLRRQFPGLEVAGAYSPPFRPLTAEEDAEVVQMINDSGADIVWVGLSTPKQERWMSEHRASLEAPDGDAVAR